MKPFLHARGSVARWGGKPDDYIEIHDFIDSSKHAMPDLRHRALLHHAPGTFIVERVFGHTIVNSDGREVSTRDIAENHVIEDMGFLPSLEDWLDELPQNVWHGGIHRLAKEKRPPTPTEVRGLRRDRVRHELIAASDIPLDGEVSRETIDKIIAAVLGTEADPDNT